MIRCAAWNVQGLNSMDKHTEVRRLISEYGLSICAVVETKVQPGNLDRICPMVFGRWNWISNQSSCSWGTRIVVGWDPGEVSLMLIGMTDQVIHCKARFIEARTSVFMSFVYAHNQPSARRALWEELKGFARVVNDDVWTLLGDFNITLFLDETEGGPYPKEVPMMEFADCVEAIQVVDLKLIGNHLTWTETKKARVGMLRKLDRILVNPSFLRKFPAAFANFLPYGVSDHSPAILYMQMVKKKKAPMFKFQNFMASHPEFMQCLRTNWSLVVDGYEQFRLVQRLKNMKPHLRKLRSAMGGLSQRVQSCRQEMLAAQRSIDADPLDESLRRTHATRYAEFLEAKADEESFFKQRAKVRWLREGDNNTAFFHNTVREKNCAHRIEAISDMHGNFFVGEEVPSQFVKFYEELLGTDSQNPRPLLDYSIFDNRLSVEEALDMVRPITRDEIKRAVFSIDEDRAPGPDGYSSKFFKASWEVIGEEVTAAISEFFMSGKLLQELNHTLISLIPKKEAPSNVSEFRPIACCNVVYKAITKIISSRIKGSLNQLVSDCQSAFIPGRRITDNILLAQELMEGYHLNNGKPRCALKVDIQKAYDSVDWNFLKNALLCFGFHYRMVNWIMACISSPSFSIMVNGEVHGYFQGKRGLRQGDPLSPYLFTLVMEVLNLMVSRRIQVVENFKFHRWCESLRITHLCFADDLLMFCSGEKISVSVLKGVLDQFAITSGLEPSLPKSTVFFCNIDEEVKAEILETLPFQEGSLPVRYLGLPLLATSLHHKDCRPLLDKIRRRIQNWKNRLLSYAGRLQLINSVLGSLMVFWGSALYLPATTIHEIEKICRGFLWCQGEMKKGKSRVAWDDVCLPKESGGLGLRRLNPWNRALMAQHMWDILRRKESLWVRWIHAYRLKGRSFWNVTEPNKCAWNWKRMLDSRDMFRSRFKAVIGDGRGTMAWYDHWMEGGPLYRKLTNQQVRRAGFSMNATVSDLFREGSWNWPLSWFGGIIPIGHHDIPQELTTKKDTVEWLTRDGAQVPFTVGQAWRCIRRSAPRVPWYDVVWHKYKIPRHSFIVWQAFHDRLLTQDRLIKWKGDSPEFRCPFCKQRPDSRDHLFFECRFPNRVWKKVKNDCDGSAMGDTWLDILAYFTRNAGKQLTMLRVHRLSFSATVYHLWKERNRRIHNQVSNKVKEIYRDIVGDLWGKLVHEGSNGLRIPRGVVDAWRLPKSLEEGECSNSAK